MGGAKIGPAEVGLVMGIAISLLAIIVSLCTKVDQREQPRRVNATEIRVGKARLYQACIGGYTFVVRNGEPTQILNDAGHGVRCEG